MERNASGQRLRGQFAPDPVSEIPVGGSLLVQSLFFQYSSDKSATWMQDWESLKGVLLAIVFSDESHQIEGSAVLVAPGVALCATHVLEPKVGGLNSPPRTIKKTIICIGPTNGEFQLWKVRKVTAVPNTDLTILGLELASSMPNGGTLYQAAISTRLPKIGEQLNIFGIRAAQDEFPRVAGKPPDFQMTVLACSGVVAERYENGRDSVMIPWPSVQVDCPSWGGMSGGPVFDSTGRVLGLLSASFSSESNDGPSFISLLFPALPTRFEGGWPLSMHTAPSSLLDEAKRMCDIDNRHAFKPVAGSNDQVLYEPWE